MTDNDQDNNIEKKDLSTEELQALEDEILNDAAGGTDTPISPNFGC